MYMLKFAFEHVRLYRTMENWKSASFRNNSTTLAHAQRKCFVVIKACLFPSRIPADRLSPTVVCLLHVGAN